MAQGAQEWTNFYQKIRLTQGWTLNFLFSEYLKSVKISYYCPFFEQNAISDLLFSNYFTPVLRLKDFLISFK